jgi:hypothetical protein
MTQPYRFYNPAGVGDEIGSFQYEVKFSLGQGIEVNSGIGVEAGGVV